MSRISRPSNKPGAAPAFTLVELLVVITVMAVLTALAFPVFGKAKESGLRGAEIAAARKLMAGFASYTADRGGSVLPGIKNPGPGEALSDANGNPVTEPGARERYAWRIAPYIDYDVDGTLLVNNAQVAPSHDPMFSYLVSALTTLGMNTTFVGGDFGSSALIKAGDQRTLNRLGPFYLQNITQAAQPSKLIVFASALNSMGGEKAVGNYRVFPPRLRGGDGSRIDYRFNGKAVSACLDGHVELLGPDEMEDMRRWSNLAALADDPDHVPR